MTEQYEIDIYDSTVTVHTATMDYVNHITDHEEIEVELELVVNDKHCKAILYRRREYGHIESESAYVVDHELDVDDFTDEELIAVEEYIDEEDITDHI